MYKLSKLPVTVVGNERHKPVVIATFSSIAEVLNYLNQNIDFDSSQRTFFITNETTKRTYNVFAYYVFVMDKYAFTKLEFINVRTKQRFCPKISIWSSHYIEFSTQSYKNVLLKQRLPELQTFTDFIIDFKEILQTPLFYRGELVESISFCSDMGLYFQKEVFEFPFENNERKPIELEFYW